MRLERCKTHKIRSRDRDRAGLQPMTEGESGAGGVMRAGGGGDSSKEKTKRGQ